jgi:hypothetical protein
MQTVATLIMDLQSVGLPTGDIVTGETADIMTVADGIIVATGKPAAWF